MEEREKSVGFFDSGVGGISVLKEALKLMPNEDYIYLGDSKHAPYGSKSLDEIKELTFSCVEGLLKQDVKAIVIACNTATSAAIDDLRERYKEIPIIGIEPAVKPAVNLNPSGKIIIMATPVTLNQKKFRCLYDHYSCESNIVPLPCAELVSFVERGEVKGDNVLNYLENKFSVVDLDKIGAIVLGCTHFPFVESSIRQIVGEKIPIIHGGEGTARRLKYLLKENDIINLSKDKGHVVIHNTLHSEKFIKLSEDLLYK